MVISTKKWYKGSDGEFELSKIVEKHGKKQERKIFLLRFSCRKTRGQALRLAPKAVFKGAKTEREV